MKNQPTTNGMALTCNKAVSATEPDWSREQSIQKRYEPSKCLLATIRRYQQLQTKHGVTAHLMRPLIVLQHRFWCAVTGADIPLNTNIGGGMLIPHPNGIVIHPDAKIGPNCLLFQQVTLGTGGPIPGAPHLAGHVDIGAGAKILGGVTIGANAKIGANAVVLDHVPEGCTAVGIPARVIQPKQNPKTSQR